jgi:hypothetical protein
MPKKDPAERKSIDLTVQVWREGSAIYVAGGPLDPITVSNNEKSKSYLPGMWQALDKVLKAHGR